jgi:hypothetical protein
MTDAVLGDVVLPRATADQRATLEALAHAQWAGHAQHPWLVTTLSMTRPQLLPNGMRHTELALRALGPLGLGPAGTIRTAVTLLAYVRGMAVGIESERQAEQDTGQTSNEWIESRDELFAPYTPQFPTLGRLARQHGIDMTLDALFERGLQLLLDGLELQNRDRGNTTSD